MAKMGSAVKDLTAVPGVAASVDPATKGFIFQQTMYRIKVSCGAAVGTGLNGSNRQALSQSHRPSRAWLAVQDPKRSLAFYTGVLGMRCA